MPMSLLSDGYVSDSFNDAGAVVAGRPSRSPVALLHFKALCRGVIVLVVLAIPLGLTVFGSERPVAPQARLVDLEKQG